ncbi:tetratricopeptide repeat protein [Paraglaciecola hydrolytica]|uniref:Uncharacterized protein n=1 Tax=Paraglaciecola hydrolytica TaxID=1799789 RepID=A0A148KM58_9ALTE|nr:hypothetical protein [Paraglaciecola hydrolytica]KXI27392.1 hypothetical protein AX660_22000 [Paraglaciecola hydrolytica]
MSKAMLSRIKWTVVAMGLATLWACSSTKVNNAQATSTNVPNLAPAKLSLLQFNQQLEQELNQDPLSSLQSKIDVLSIARHLRLKHPEQYANPLNTAKVAADVKQQLISGMLDVSQTFSWHYLRSETFKDNSLAAYYRIDSDGGYSYVTLWLEPDSYQIYDFHSVSYAFSALDFVGKFSQLFTQYTNSQSQLNNLVKALQMNELDEAVRIYNNLDPLVKNDAALHDFLLRKYSQLPAENAKKLQTIVLANLEQPGKSSLLFEAHYIQLDNFAAAIKMVEGLPLFALQDSKMQSELAILHAYNRQFESAVSYGRQAILAEPNQREVYFVLLQVSFLAKDYGLSLALMDVLVAKFNYVMSPQVISEFEDGLSFIESGEYQSWLTQRMNS